MLKLLFQQRKQNITLLFIPVFHSDNRQGTCWLNIVNGNCENNLPGQLTQSECCGSIGQAWGSPCAPCPTQSKSRIPKCC